MLITDYLIKECIAVNLKAGEKEKIISELAELQFENYPEIDKDEAIVGLSEREKILSTGIGKGIAIPHARLESSRRISVSFGLMQGETDFEAIDNQPVRIIFLIFFPKDEVNLQLRFLARISRLLRDAALREKLLSCECPEDVIDTFRQFEAQHFH
ncbi:MAG: PTS sugar transporter subunit IIA [Deltaproteobacteria bacterium]|jgi:mannitol/fructose-specific phosphotransferase system IIA component (Ntr-type)|nr:PTS sugar transporter subunit IIA [Deltaproteobacteria bacterium]MBT4265207.1 PTS sugar transporter subunit IIA [Deltaproteobacteria bacterium]MBT4638602.1 PTS sugar transporter subunit IIA [Deltaproteobacteria bacterium]MBT6503535.1 PTS sugar transporter subunit IIA [Deltaproteobacteria bacterium]MBT6610928.1 PTS sugar transporter subunit IIA [Deltaproteobacteria bacterium]